MAAEDKIMEALARIEHKQDLILEIVAKLAGIKSSNDLPKVGDPNHPCVLCTQPIKYDVDISKGVVVRKCGCGTGKIALDMGAFAPPMPSAHKKDEDDVGSEEDRSNTNRRGGRPGRR